MVEYIQNYIDVLTGKCSADDNTKTHFKENLLLEINKILPLVLECKDKGVDIYRLAPELMQDFNSMLDAYTNELWQQKEN